jgi:hypothetical protein
MVGGLALKPLTRNLTCVVTSAELDGARVRVRFKPSRGAEVSDWISFEPRGEPQVVQSVGRFIRILRAGRIRPPADPYGLGANPDEAVRLLQSCTGARVKLKLRQKTARTLRVWTEAGIDRFERVIDVEESGDALLVKRTGGRSALRIPRQSLIRYELTSIEELVVVSVDPAH